MAEMTPRQRAFYQGLFGLGAGILANNAPSKVPGGGMRALGKGLQQGLQTFNQALTLEDKMDALREERALKGELQERIPELIAQAEAMGVDQRIIRSAELMASVNPSQVVNTLNNAMVKAQRRPEEEPQTFVVDSEMRRMIGLPETVTTGMTSKEGIRKFFDKFGQPVTGFPEQPVIEDEPFQSEYFELEEDERKQIDDPRVVRKRSTEDGQFEYLNKYNQVVKKAPDPAKEEPFKATTVPIDENDAKVLNDPRIRYKTKNEDGSVTFLDQYYTPVTGPAETVEPEPVTPLFMTGAELRSKEPALANALKLDDGDIFQITYNDKGKPTNAFKPDWTKEKPVEERPTYLTKEQALAGNTTEQAFAKRMGDQDFLLKTGGKYTIEDMTPKEKKVDPDVFKNESVLRKEFNQVSKDYTGAVQAYMAVLQGAQLQNSTGDLMLIQAFQKMLDPTSVVRETEFANAQNTQGVLQKLGITIEKLKDGDMLSASARAKFVDASRAYMSQVQKAFEPQKKYYLETARRAGISEKAIRDPFAGVQGIDPSLATINFQEIYDAVDESTISGNVKGASPIKEESPQASAMKTAIDSVIPTIDEYASKIEIPKVEFSLPADAKRTDNIEDDQELESIFD